MQIKVFTNSMFDDMSLEDRVNEWLANEGKNYHIIDIKPALTSTGERNIMTTYIVMVVYELNRRAKVYGE